MPAELHHWLRRRAGSAFAARPADDRLQTARADSVFAAHRRDGRHGDQLVDTENLRGGCDPARQRGARRDADRADGLDPTHHESGQRSRTLNSEIEVLKSRKLIEDVVRKLDAEESAGMPESSSGLIRALMDETDLPLTSTQLVLDLQGDLDISAVEKSNVIKMSYSVHRSCMGDPGCRDAYGRVSRAAGRAVSVSPGRDVFRAADERRRTAARRQHEQALEQFVDEASITMVEGSEWIGLARSSKRAGDATAFRPREQPRQR